MTTQIEASDEVIAPSGHGDAGGPRGQVATEAKPHLDHVDAVRPVKQFGVISTHSVLFFAPIVAASEGTLMLLHVSREAFFFVSACMLAYANPTITRRTIGSFYRRRAVTIVLPYAAWTLIYWGTEITFPFRLGPELHNLLHLAVTGYYQLYYLLVIAQFYVLYPLLLQVIRAFRARPATLIVATFVAQLTLVSLMHWKVLPGWMQNYWATREVTSYTLYLVGGVVAAMYLPAFERWLFDHVREVLLFTLGSAAIAETWFTLAWYHDVHFLGTASDAFQPIVVPFNVGAILSLYILGKYLVSAARSTRVRTWVRVGSDNAYGIFLAQMVFIHLLVDVDWNRHLGFLPWPVVVLACAAIVFSACWALSWTLSHTAASRWLTGQRRIPWNQRAKPVSDVPVYAIPAPAT